LTGGAGNDVLIGGFGDDTMRGQAGNDKISTLDGNDVVVYESIGDGRDALFSFDGDATDGQDVLNLDALFDSLAIADGSRAARVQITDKGATVEVRVDSNGDASFDLFVAVLQTADAITVGADVVVVG
jgi:Ca2+-binding RTX toxin-like protein